MGFLFFPISVWGSAWRPFGCRSSAIIAVGVLCGIRRYKTFILLIKFYNKVQSSPRLTLLSSNDECDSVARDAFILGVFIALVAEIFCVNVAGSTLSGVV